MHTTAAALLVGSADEPKLHPLTAGTPKALLPVANEPLLSFSLQALENSGVQTCFIVSA